MNHSGDVAEQIVRMSLEGVEVAAKITGTAAKEIALLLIAALKNNSKGSLKLKGKARLTTMLKSGKALEIFSVKESDLLKFAQGAKQYGIVYCVLRNTKSSPDGLCDVMVKADDAPKISRLVERFQFATVDKAKIEHEIVAAKTEKATGMEPGAPDVGDTEKLLDDLLGTDEGKVKQDMPEPNITEPVKAGKEATDSSPFFKSDPSMPPQFALISESRSKSAKGTLSRPSVKEELRDIVAARKAKESDTPVRNELSAADKSKNTPATTMHQQPSKNRKSKRMRGSR